jgi:hypothetical protein
MFSYIISTKPWLQTNWKYRRSYEDGFTIRPFPDHRFVFFLWLYNVFGAVFSVSYFYTQPIGLLDGGSARLKAATYTQNNTNTE